METAPFSCADPEVAALKPGSKPEHFEVMKLFAAPLFWDGGKDFPDGILFASKIGGMPVPTGKARDYFKNGILQEAKEAEAHPVDFCSSQGTKVLTDTMIKSLEAHKDDLKEYAEKTCDALFKGEKSITGSRAVLANGARAIISKIPEALKIEPDARVVAALAEIVLTFDLDSKSGDLIF